MAFARDGRAADARRPTRHLEPCLGPSPESGPGCHSCPVTSVLGLWRPPSSW